MCKKQLQTDHNIYSSAPVQIFCWLLLRTGQLVATYFNHCQQRGFWLGMRIGVYPAISIKNDTTQHAQVCCWPFLHVGKQESGPFTSVVSNTRRSVWRGWRAHYLLSYACYVAHAYPLADATPLWVYYQPIYNFPTFPSQTAIVNTPVFHTWHCKMSKSSHTSL